MVSKEATLGVYARDNGGASRFTEETRNEIIAALNERIRITACPLCGTNGWTLAEGFAPLALQGGFYGFQVGERVLPCVALVCNNCGNTHLINLLNIGLRHLVEKLQVPVK